MTIDARYNDGTAEEDLYTVLGVDKGANVEEIRRGYKQRALETHPDKVDHGNTPERKEEAERNFRRVHEAFALLNDPIKRRIYDKEHGIRSNVQRDWSIFTDETNLRRAEERQAWAEQADARSRARMAAFRESARQRREAFLEEQRARREQAEMIATMLDALCQLGPEERKNQTQKMPKSNAKIEHL